MVGTYLGAARWFPVSRDNKVVLNLGSRAEKELKANQAQFNILHVMNVLIAESPVDSAFRWVAGHSVENRDSNIAHIPKS